MNAAQLRARLEADLLTDRTLRQAERPGGLTASGVGGCSQYGARELLGVLQGSEGEFWRALRGDAMHDGIADALARVDPEFEDCRTRLRFTWHPGGGLPPITGAGDFVLGGVWVEAKSRSRGECRGYQDHGPAPQHCIQASIGAEAEGFADAAVFYMPVDGGWEEASVHMVDVRHWTREARYWLERVDVRAEYEEMVQRGTPPGEALRRVLDPIPREPSVNWCEMFCGHFADCRAGYVAPPDLEIADPLLRRALEAAEYHREQRLLHDKKEKAAKALLAHAEGRTSVPSDGGAPIEVRQQPVPGTEKRRGHTKTVITRRPA